MNVYGLTMEDVVQLESVTLGRFNDGVPYIDINVDGDLLSVFKRQISNTTIKMDRDYASTFFHEYIHQIQAALLYPMQSLFIRQQWRIYEIFQTGVARKNSGCSSLLPISYSEDFAAKDKQVTKIFCPFQVVGEKYEPIGAIEILEGIARILQESYYGVRKGDLPKYTATRRISNEILGVGRLRIEELLDVCELSLRTDSPGYSFFRLMFSLRNELEELRQKKFYDSLCGLASRLGLVMAPDLTCEIVENVKRLFVSNVFKHLQTSMINLYTGLKELFPDTPVFSSLYSLTKQASTKDQGLFPYWFMIVLGKAGTPPVRNANGFLEQLSHIEYGKQDQTAIAVEAVINSILANGGEYACELHSACLNSLRNKVAINPDKQCESRPWLRSYACGQACPYQVVWKALGLEGLKLVV